jgi:PAS domain S-box-containing protein
MRDVFSTSFPDTAATNLLDSIPHGIAVIARDLKIVAINDFLEALTGVVRADVTGVYVDFVLRSNIAQRGRTFREVLGRGEQLVLDGDIVSRDRRKLPMQFTISPLRNRAEEVVGLVIVLDDLSAMVASARRGRASRFGAGWAWPPQPIQEAGKDWLALEKELIISTLTQTRGNRSNASDILGWGRTTLWRKLKTHGLVTPPVPSNTKEEA